MQWCVLSDASLLFLCVCVLYAYMRVSLSVVLNNFYSSIFQVFGLPFFIFPPETAFRVGALSVCLCFQKLCLFVCVYELRFNSPCSYRQPNGNGQLLSRRYCKHSGCLFSCANRTARESQGALAVSCKYFKQSKWPNAAAYSHAYLN